MPSKPKLLVAYCGLCNHVQTTFEYLKSFSLNSRVSVDYAHVTKQYDVSKSVNFGTDLSLYYAVILHYSARLSIKDYVSEAFLTKLKEFQGVKVVIAQDEYENTNVLKKNLDELAVNLLVTCVPREGIDYVYGDLKSKNLRFFHALTGYVSDSFKMQSASPPPIAERPIHVGYRGRNLGGRYGALARDKYEIGQRVRSACKARQIPCDIQMDEGSRIYGMDWHSFLHNCRAALGTQSGSNVFDFDGSLDSLYVDLQSRASGGVPDYADFSIYTDSRESDVDMGQISPSIFEYAQCKTAMILLEGSYSGAILPDVHYIPLKKDYSNLDSALDRLLDIDALEKMTNKAFEDLILSDEYIYNKFTNRLLDTIEEIRPFHSYAEPPVPGKYKHLGLFDVWQSFDLWDLKPSSNIIGPEHLLARQRISNYKQELWRMASLERQIVDGYKIRFEEIGSVSRDHQLVTAVAKSVSLLIQMRGERNDACRLLFKDGQIDETLIESTSFLFERQVNQMYATYHQLLEALSAI